jgi:4-hydroxybenzoate polyprenyltransferase
MRVLDMLLALFRRCGRGPEPVIFAALVFDRQLGLNNLPHMIRTLAGFFLFCLLSGVVYLINDIADVEADRRHPTKRKRPIASGALPIPVARAAAAGLILVVFPLSYWPLLLLPWSNWSICCSTWVIEIG